MPPGWFNSSFAKNNGYTAKIVTEKPEAGRQAVQVALEGERKDSNAFGNLLTYFDATPYRGKRIRFRAAVRAEVSGGNQAALWLRVDREGGAMGFFDNMADRPIRSSEWKTYEITGEVAESPRNSIMYFSDDGDVIALRVGDYKYHLAQQRANTMRQWAEPFVKLRVPYIFNLRRDPFERADFNSNTYMDWMVDHVPQLYQMQAVIAGQIADFIKFPPRQRPASFNLDAVMAQVAVHSHS